MNVTDARADVAQADVNGHLLLLTVPHNAQQVGMTTLHDNRRKLLLKRDSPNKRNAFDSVKTAAGSALTVVLLLNGAGSLINFAGRGCLYPVSYSYSYT